MPDLSAKLQGHIYDGESKIGELDGLCSAAIMLAQDVLGGRPGDVVSQTARDGLHTVIGVIGDRVRDLNSWWTQLHEMGVVRSGENGNV